MPFEWISSEPTSSTPYISIDSQRRFYISQTAAELIGIKSWPAQLYIGYDHVNKRIVVGKPGVVRPTDVKPYRFNDRHNASARPFIAKAKIDINELPQRYIYVGRDHSVDVPDGAFAFELEGYAAPDEPR
ncbi:MAG: hypothetical protein IRZ03_18265 [Acidobacterium ailaaui]|nr:hypothetical protein [Pseudacidobacterium ailaaui]